jgi:hypothetical protein
LESILNAHAETEGKDFKSSKNSTEDSMVTKNILLWESTLNAHAEPEIFFLAPFLRAYVERTENVVNESSTLFFPKKFTSKVGIHTFFASHPFISGLQSLQKILS